MTRGYDRAKRVFDLAVTVPVFVLTLPIQAATALAIRVRLGSPVLFRQTRPGLHAEPFVMVKFRTMLNTDPALGLVADVTRLNFNVTYEVGYAIGLKKRVLLVRNAAFHSSAPAISEVGIFDTPGHLTYENSSELATLMTGAFRESHRNPGCGAK